MGDWEGLEVGVGGGGGSGVAGEGWGGLERVAMEAQQQGVHPARAAWETEDFIAKLVIFCPSGFPCNLMIEHFIV